MLVDDSEMQFPVKYASKSCKQNNKTIQNEIPKTQKKKKRWNWIVKHTKNLDKAHKTKSATLEWMAWTAAMDIYCQQLYCGPLHIADELKWWCHRVEATAHREWER